jgi:hypothetical protein
MWRANEDSRGAVLRAADSVPLGKEVSDVQRFETDGELRTADGYDAGIQATGGDEPGGAEGQSDLQRWIEHDFHPRVDSVCREFGN